MVAVPMVAAFAVGVVTEIPGREPSPVASAPSYSSCCPPFADALTFAAVPAHGHRRGPVYSARNRSRRKCFSISRNTKLAAPIATIITPSASVRGLEPKIACITGR